MRGLVPPVEVDRRGHEDLLHVDGEGGGGVGEGEGAEEALHARDARHAGSETAILGYSENSIFEYSDHAMLQYSETGIFRRQICLC